MAEGWVAQWRKFLHGRSMSDLPPGPIDNRSLLVVKGNSLELTRSKWQCLQRCMHVSVLHWPLCPVLCVHLTCSNTLERVNMKGKLLSKCGTFGSHFVNTTH